MSASVRVSTALAQHDEQKEPREKRLVSLYFHTTPSLREDIRQELKKGPGKAEPME